MEQNRIRSLFFGLNFMLLMLCLGCSDAARGAFMPVIRQHFSLQAAQLSLFISISYIGNLLFMLLGGRMADVFGIKRLFLTAMSSFLLAMLLYMASNAYVLLLAGVFLAMGSSTLLNTYMSLLSPGIFKKPGMTLNLLFFVQGIGTTATQSLISSRVSRYWHWRAFAGVMALLGTAALLLFLFLSRQAGTEGGPQKKGSRKAPEGKSPVKAIVFLILIFGFYFVAEHGAMNWLKLFCMEARGMEAGRAAFFSALLFIGIMAGRLVLAPFVERLGMGKSLLLAFWGGAIFYILAFTLKNGGLLLLLPAGLLCSILYPTLCLYVRLYFADRMAASAMGIILSGATVFDIVFNSLFGILIDRGGFERAILTLPAAFAAGAVLYLVFVRRYSLCS